MRAGIEGSTNFIPSDNFNNQKTPTTSYNTPNTGIVPANDDEERTTTSDKATRAFVAGLLMNINLPCMQNQ